MNGYPGIDICQCKADTKRKDARLLVLVPDAKYDTGRLVVVFTFVCRLFSHLQAPMDGQGGDSSLHTKTVLPSRRTYFRCSTRTLSRGTEINEFMDTIARWFHIPSIMH